MGSHGTGELLVCLHEGVAKTWKPRAWLNGSRVWQFAAHIRRAASNFSAWFQKLF